MDLLRSNIKLSGICRACMTEALNMSSIYDYPNREDRIDNAWRFVDLWAITIPQLAIIEDTDELPKEICHDCMNKLLSAHDFREMCLQSQHRLRDMLRDDTPDARSKQFGFITDSNVSDCITQDPLEDDGDSEEKDVAIKAELDNLLTNLEDESAASPPQNTPKSDSIHVLERKQRCCSTCDKKFANLSNLKRHMKRRHNIIVPPRLGKPAETVKNPSIRPVCKYCEKSFKNKHTLYAHSSIHTGERPYLCTECGKSFRISTLLQRHLECHLEELKYECSECPKKFRTYVSLDCHKRMHLKKNRYICELCSKEFYQSYALRKHKMVHTGDKPLKCDVCEMRFRFIGHLRLHMRTHTGEKPYKCRYCEKSFAQSVHLNRHLRLHIGENIYECELCPQSFRKHTEMREHFVLHKEDNEETREQNLKDKMEADKLRHLSIK